MDPHQDKVLMEVILSSIQVVLNKGKELVVVEVVVMMVVQQVAVEVVVEAQVHVLVKLVDQQVNHPHLDQEQITEIEEEIITHLVMVGHQLEEEVQVHKEQIQVLHNIMVEEMEVLVYNYQSVEPQPIMVVAVVLLYTIL